MADQHDKDLHSSQSEADVSDSSSTSEGLEEHTEPPVTFDPSDQAVREADRAFESQLQGLPLSEADVADMLTELGELAQRTGMKSLEREVQSERLPALRRGRITLVVLGEFNHGKSTVVNALLGETILPTGITPTTAVITHLVNAAEPRVTIKPADGSDAYDIAYEEMEHAVRTEEEEGKETEYVQISYPNDLLQNSLVLVDTPGVNDISQQKVEITYGYLPRADVVLYVLDATQVLKKSEVVFIRDRLLKANRDRIVFVLNKVDALAAEDVAEVEQYARERLQSLVGPVDLFSFSARDALRAQREGQALPDDFINFRQHLMQFIGEQRAYIILDSALAGGLRIAALLEQNLAIKRQGYRLEKEELRRRIDAVHGKLTESRKLIAQNVQSIEETISGLAATARHNLRVFTDDFAEKLPIEIEKAEAKDVKRYLSPWIQDQFKAWIEDEGQELAAQLEALAEEVIETTNESMREAVETFREEFGLSGELDLDVDTIGYDVSVFALGTLGVSFLLFANVLIGGLLTLATPVLAFFLKEKIDAKVKERARDEGVKAVHIASERLEAELLRVMHDYGDRLRDFVETAGDRLYRQVEEALEQVEEDLEHNTDREALLREVESRLENVRQTARVMRSSREQLAKAVTEQVGNSTASPT